ncbi:MAG TPA: pyruvate kinase [Pirellulaceae bacterium]|nr:pyruvate kinase [Pirellulaceae bacterium]HMO92325.1 pyruvate kinase [Pirellulaceae bacterium]HMP69249.1 pyruvate kinase [Pirellulaceae bacterium]
MVQFPRLSKFAHTKTVATIGPASNSLEMLKILIDEGVDVFRLNMAHGTRADHDLAVQQIRLASDQLQWPVAILIDLAGPKIRLGQLHTDPLCLIPGAEVEFVRGTQSASPLQLTCSYENLVDEVAAGDTIVLSDGLVRLIVKRKAGDCVVCEVVDGGEIRSRQGVNLPGVKLKLTALSDVDRDNAAWGAKVGVDFVGLSFVRTAQEVNELKALLRANDSQAMVIAKIEKSEALDHLVEIISAADAIMVARGDLGVEIRIEKTPIAQKRIIETCQRLSKPVIVATQMLESMHTNRQPTRAEVTDVANAILDGADACMLSGETAIGSYPRDAVAMMHRIMHETEPLLAHRTALALDDEIFKRQGITEAVVFGAGQIAKRLTAKAVVIATASGQAALVKSKHRDFIPTLAVTDSRQVAQQMCLLWGICPIYCEEINDTETLTHIINEWAVQDDSFVDGDRIVIVLDTKTVPGTLDSIVVMRIRKPKS